MTKPLLRPLNNNVLAEVVPRPANTQSKHLFIPDSAKGRETMARVIASSFEGVRPGDVVVFNPYKIRAVLAEGQTARAAGTPIANVGDRFVIDGENLEGVYMAEVDEPMFRDQVRAAIPVIRQALAMRDRKDLIDSFFTIAEELDDRE